MPTDIAKIQEEIKKELSNKSVLNALVATTFKGLEVPQIYLAIQEGRIRGFEFKDFLEKNVYAIPFKGGYSLITSIDYARKVGMRSGVVGVSAPTFTEDKDGKIVSCTVTVKRKVGEYVGEYSATVYFSEYNTGRNLWVSKPRTMIQKVAEVHALRKACPEEASMMYVEEEIEQEIEKPLLETASFKEKLEACKDMAELKKVWSALPAEAKKELELIKKTLKTGFEIKEVTSEVEK